MTPSLSTLTTLRLGGAPRKFIETETEEDFTAAIAEADRAGEPLLVLGGGSNVVVSDSGFDGTVVHDGRRDVTPVDASSCAGVTLRMAGGAHWDSVVEQAVAHEWVGIEGLSGIPGSVGATPVQNVGAYGQEVGDVLSSVRVWDRVENRTRMFAVGELQLGYRDSILKRTLLGATPRWVVLSVELQMREGSLGAPIKYRQLADYLGVDVGERAPISRVREAVLALRGSKGMVLDPEDHDTWSAGSFFTNPILSAEQAADLPEDAPRFDAGEGRVKSSAAWLIEHAGFHRGYGLPGPAALSTKHTLALTNRGTARTEDVVNLSREVRAGVLNKFGVELVPEPMLIGTELGPA